MRHDCGLVWEYGVNNSDWLAPKSLKTGRWSRICTLDPSNVGAMLIVR
jgi:hypothetical protein